MKNPELYLRHVVSWAIESLAYQLQAQAKGESLAETDRMLEAAKNLRRGEKISGVNRAIQDRFAFALSEARVNFEEYDEIKDAFFFEWMDWPRYAYDEEYRNSWLRKAEQKKDFSAGE